jgi:hypothetical protein
VTACVVLMLVLSPSIVLSLPAPIEEGLKTSTFVYISSTRKDGSLSKAAEIWFMYHDGGVYVGTSPKSWRAKRITWKRPQAKIWVGKQDGPAFTATGAFVHDAATQELLLKTFAQKYPDGWGKWEKSFRDGFKDGTRVMIKYTPTESR